MLQVSQQGWRRLTPVRRLSCGGLLDNLVDRTPSVRYHRRMKIYTKTGDDGTTGLIGGLRVHKSDPRIERYGAVDELNAVVGLSIVIARETAPGLGTILLQVQNDLFVAGSHLATPEDSPHRKNLPALDESIVSAAGDADRCGGCHTPRLEKLHIARRD